MIVVTTNLVCDVCEESHDVSDVANGNPFFIRRQAAKHGWLVNFRNGDRERIDICDECKVNLAKPQRPTTDEADSSIQVEIHPECTCYDWPKVEAAGCDVHNPPLS